MSAEFRMECVKVAATLTSSTVADRAEETIRVAEALYKHVFQCNMEGNSDTPVTPPRRGRPPRPRTSEQ